jgi:hypothetical protein
MAYKRTKQQAEVKPCDLINLGVIAKTFPRKVIDRVLEQTNKSSKRQRDLPAHVVMYYVIAMTLYMQHSYREVLRTLLEGLRGVLMLKDVHVAGKAGISRARTRLGEEAVQQLHDEIVTPIAQNSPGKRTRGAWYRDRHLVTLDGSTLDVADSDENARDFGRGAGKYGQAAFPQIRFVSLLENGTHVLFASRMGPLNVSENTLAAQVAPHLSPGMLCLADRTFFSYSLWRDTSARGVDLLWRVKKNLRLPCRKRLADGSYLSKVYPNSTDRRYDRNGIAVRVIEYQLAGAVRAEPLYRLITTILDWREAPARELAGLYHERWEVETALDELKTHLLGARVILRSRRPHLVRQEFYGFMMGHFAVRAVMHEAALAADVDADTLSFLHAVRVIRRKMATFSAFSPSAAFGVA